MSSDRVLVPAAAVALAGPTVLAFASGGYFDQARLAAALVAWGLVALVAVAAPRPLPRTLSGRVALLGLAALTGWVAASISWAPLRGPAFDDSERLVLYLGALIAAIGLLRARVARAVEPALVAGIAVVIGYGLLGRLLPGLIHEAASRSAGGRLEQPLTYWNAIGALAAIGFVLACRLVGDTTRAARTRLIAAALMPTLGVGLYLSFSRAAVAAAAAGLVVLLAAAPTWPQLRAIVLAGEGAGAVALVASRFDGVQSLSGGLGLREGQGAAMLVVLLVVSALGAATTSGFMRREAAGTLRAGALELPPRLLGRLALLVVAAITAVTLMLAHGERHDLGTQQQFGARTDRFATLRSNRFAYWRVARREFARHPLRGAGSSAFAVDWLRERPVVESAHDAHSLYIETAAELGLIGLAILGALLAAIASATRAAWRRSPQLAAGWCAALTVFALHAGLDWDWEMPALTLVALLLAGAALAAADDAAAQT